MILFKVASAPCVQEYVGCDLSGLADKHFDAVVCNGVSMYFPSATYLVDVLLAGLPKIKPDGGVYHMGDVISREHYDFFLTRRARLLTHSFDELQDSTVRAALFKSAKDRCYEQELFFALQLANGLPGVAAVEVQLKHGEIMNEFNRYRYNVLLHLGEKPTQALDVVAIPETDAASRESAEAVASKLAALANDAPRAVVACHGILNARLSADALLFAGLEDAAAPAVQVGVGAGGGVDPPMLRAALRAKLPNYHVVLQWARDGKAEHMDVYAIPTRPTARSSDPLLAGLDSVMRSACALVGTDSLVQRASGAKIESFTNQLQTVDESKSTSNADSEAALAEAKKQWASADR